MPRGFWRPHSFWALLLVFGCAAGDEGCGGCAAPIPQGFPTGPEHRANNAITAKLSPAGISFLESEINNILTSVAGNQLQNLQVGCMNETQTFDNPTCEVLCVGPRQFDVPIFACDHNGDFRCTAADNAPPVRDRQRPTTPPLRACQAATKVSSFKIVPKQSSAREPLLVGVSLRLLVNTGSIPIRAKDPFDICEVSCSIELDSNASGQSEIPVDVDITLEVDRNDPTQVLSFSVGRINLNEIFESGDLLIERDGSGVCSTLICGAGSLNFVKDFVFNMVRGTVERTIYDLIDTFRCRPCEELTNNCPANSQCVASQGVCYSCTPGAADCRPQYDPGRNVRVCPPASLGLEGRMTVGDFLAEFGAPTNSLLDVYAVAGGITDGVPDVRAEPYGTTPNQSRGIVIGMMGGTRPVIREADGSFTAPGRAKCVPLRPFTQREQADPVNFEQVALDGNASEGLSGIGLSDYQLGVSLSDAFLDKSFHDLYQAGLLCLNVDASVSTFLSSSLFRTFLPSLGVLTQGKDVPMLVALRPKQPPTVTLGLGTTRLDPQTGNRVPDDPLLTIDLKQLQIDFYAFIEERQARLFSLTTDITLPLSLEFNPSLNTVRPILADLEHVAQNFVASNSEMLAEDPRIVGDLVDAIIGLIQPMLSSLLTPIELPTFNGFKLQIRHARGTVEMPFNARGYQHLALLADLKVTPPGNPLVAAADTDAQLVETFVPTRTELLGEVGARPRAVVVASGRGISHRSFRGYEYSYRVDQGLWSAWAQNPRLEIRSPVLLFEGRHDIEVRAREIGAPETEDLTPVHLPFLVDYEAPRVRLELDPVDPIVRTHAVDGVARADELVYRYRVDGGGWTADGPAREYTLAELGTNPSLEVEVVDTAGHVGRAYFGSPAGSLDVAPEVASRGVGCSQGGLGPLTVLGLVGAFALRRRRR